MSGFIRCIALALAAVIAQTADAGMRLTPEAIIDWQAHSFAGETDYALTETSHGTAVRAVCENGTASGLVYTDRVDLSETPVIEWRWRVVDAVETGDPRHQSGDDYAARLYAVDEHAILRWRTRAINYVSSTRARPGAQWPNAFAGQAQMVVVDSLDGSRTGKDGWRVHRRNLRKDFQQLHGRTVNRINALALMTDCDNTGNRAEALYGTIRLLPES